MRTLRRGSLNWRAEGWADTWTWVALDADSKLVVSYLVGGRDGWWAREFMNDRAARVKGPLQLTTDGHRAYLDAVEEALGMDVDYAQLQKIYGPSDEPESGNGEGRIWIDPRGEEPRVRPVRCRNV